MAISFSIAARDVGRRRAPMAARHSYGSARSCPGLPNSCVTPGFGRTLQVVNGLSGAHAPDPRPEASEHLTVLWNEHAGRVLAYASRQVDVHEAQEIVAETFLVAWRRIEEVPDPPLPWLLVVARNTISNHVRTTVRRRRTDNEFEKLERHVMARDGVDATAEERDAVLRGLRGVSDDDREVLLLTGWDGLTPTEAARVLGCSPTTYRARLSRARRRFERAAQADDQTGSTTRFFRRTR